MSGTMRAAGSVCPLQKGVEPVEGGVPRTQSAPCRHSVAAGLLVLCSTLDEPSRHLLTLDNFDPDPRERPRFCATLVLDAPEANEEDLCTNTR